MLQALIEHVANHDHSALRPLSHAAELWMIELPWRPFPWSSAPSNVSATSGLTPWRVATSVTIRRPSDVRCGIVGRIRRAVGEGESLHGETQRQNKRLYVVCSERESWKSTEGPHVCLWTRRANRGAKLRVTGSIASGECHTAQVNGQTPRGAPDIFRGIPGSHLPWTTVSTRAYGPLRCNFFGRSMT
jgi:hypothetical protein